jgi:type IV fimbrial biogenesis protein FimT
MAGSMAAMKANSRGFTLIELMTGLMILAILMALAVPTFREFTRNNAVTAAHNDLVTSLQVARSEALRRNRPVSVCATPDGEECGAGTDWATGWMAFTDRGAAGELDDEDEILQRWQPQNSTLLFEPADDIAFIQFLPTGMAADAANMDILWDGCTGERRRQISVLITGAVTGAHAAC